MSVWERHLDDLDLTTTVSERAPTPTTALTAAVPRIAVPRLCLRYRLVAIDVLALGAAFGAALLSRPGRAAADVLVVAVAAGAGVLSARAQGLYSTWVNSMRAVVLARLLRTAAVAAVAAVAAAAAGGPRPCDRPRSRRRGRGGILTPRAGTDELRLVVGARARCGPLSPTNAARGHLGRGAPPDGLRRHRGRSSDIGSSGGSDPTTAAQRRDDSGALTMRWLAPRPVVHRARWCSPTDSTGARRAT